MLRYGFKSALSCRLTLRSIGAINIVYLSLKNFLLTTALNYYYYYLQMTQIWKIILTSRKKVDHR